MVSTGKIVKVKSSAYYKHNKWWIEVVVETFNKQTFNTFVCEDTKLKVLENGQIGKFTVFSH